MKEDNLPKFLKMSKYSSHAITVSSGCDIVKYLQDFTTTQNFQAAFVVQCVGEVSKATLRMAESWKAHEPVSCFVVCLRYNFYWLVYVLFTSMIYHSPHLPNMEIPFQLR